MSDTGQYVITYEYSVAMYLYYLTRARSEPQSDPVKPVIGKSVTQ